MIIKAELTYKVEESNPENTIALETIVSLFDSENSNSNLIKLLNKMIFIEEQYDYHKRVIEKATINIGSHTINIHNVKECQIVIDSLHAYAWALANEI